MSTFTFVSKSPFEKIDYPTRVYLYNLLVRDLSKLVSFSRVSPFTFLSKMSAYARCTVPQALGEVGITFSATSSGISLSSGLGDCAFQAGPFSHRYALLLADATGLFPAPEALSVYGIGDGELAKTAGNAPTRNGDADACTLWYKQNLSPTRGSVPGDILFPGLSPVSSDEVFDVDENYCPSVFKIKKTVFYLSFHAHTIWKPHVVKVAKEHGFAVSFEQNRASTLFTMTNWAYAHLLPPPPSVFLPSTPIGKLWIACTDFKTTQAPIPRPAAEGGARSRIPALMQTPVQAPAEKKTRIPVSSVDSDSSSEEAPSPSQGLFGRRRAPSARVVRPNDGLLPTPQALPPTPKSWTQKPRSANDSSLRRMKIFESAVERDGATLEEVRALLARGESVVRQFDTVVPKGSANQRTLNRILQPLYAAGMDGLSIADINALIDKVFHPSSRNPRCIFLFVVWFRLSSHIRSGESYDRVVHLEALREFNADEFEDEEEDFGNE